MCGFMQKQYVPIMFVRVYWAVGLRVKMLKSDIEMDSKEMEVMTTWNESKLINI
jgi:hypothetical protein